MMRLYATTAQDGLEDFERLRATELAAEITPDGVDTSCADHESFVRVVDELLEEPSHITLTTTPAQQGSVLRYIRDIEDMDPAVATEGSSGHCDAPDPAG